MAEWCSPARYVHGQEAFDRRLKFLTMNGHYTFQSSDEIIDLDALVAGLTLG
jgi:hypothetical protein